MRGGFEVRSVQLVEISCHWQGETFYVQPSAYADVKLFSFSWYAEM